MTNILPPSLLMETLRAFANWYYDGFGWTIMVVAGVFVGLLIGRLGPSWPLVLAIIAIYLITVLGLLIIRTP